MSRAALFSAGAVGLALGSTDCTSRMHQPLYGGSIPIDDDGSSPSDDGAGPAFDAAATPKEDGAVEAAPPADGAGAAMDAADGAKAATDASDAADAPPMAMPLYGGFMRFDGSAPGDGGTGG